MRNMHKKAIGKFDEEYSKEDMSSFLPPILHLLC